jgi:integrase
MVSDEEITRLKAACRADGLRGARDLAILVLGIAAGLRREEIADLAVGDVDLANGWVQVRHGKGDKARVAILPPDCRDPIRLWLRLRTAAASDPLVCGVRFRRGSKTLALENRSVSATTVWQALMDLQERAGLRPTFKPHDMRRTAITRMIRAGIPLPIIAKAVGHASVSTTQRYDLTGVDAMADAINRAPVGAFG